MCVVCKNGKHFANTRFECEREVKRVDGQTGVDHTPYVSQGFRQTFMGKVEIYGRLQMALALRAVFTLFDE